MLRIAAQQQLGQRWSPGFTRLEWSSGIARRAIGMPRTDQTIWRFTSSLSNRVCTGLSYTGMSNRHTTVDLRSKREGGRRIVAAMDRTESETDDSEATGLKSGDSYAEKPSAVGGMSSFNRNMNKATKWIAATLAVVAVLWRHDEHALWFSIGAVVNGGLCKLLKYLFNESRPDTAAGVKTDPGMPSSHAQGLAYLGTYAAAALLLWQGPNAWTLLGATALIGTWMYWSWLRIHDGLHTVPQVLVGNALGVLMALGWLFTWRGVVGPAVQSSEVVRIALIGLFATAVILCYFLSFKDWKLGEL